MPPSPLLLDGPGCTGFDHACPGGAGPDGSGPDGTASGGKRSDGAVAQAGSAGAPGVGGMTGRPNKDPDTCYSFWVGGAMANLGAFSLVNRERCAASLWRCVGGGGAAGGERQAYE